MTNKNTRQIPSEKSAGYRPDALGAFHIYNDPLGYADLILNGDPEEYLKNVSGSRTLED